ncbi:hypothetical protein JYK14_02940 [Siccirubricoccus sp. KC 17139]|uniref:Uncharacterized protein n=1 Tax=Siccirubricoccus soli TaxID=2899147 RepID=A0ABT1CZN6_9PROT|nr:hypothetical protein [Siccirubricoccus soli]MCO6415133.1 hypothetical protein [Siccirubricoccus soli]MCP2681264.1 hypothetical protein [Siccirubricoccus soli]
MRPHSPLDLVVLDRRTYRLRSADARRVRSLHASNPMAAHDLAAKIEAGTAADGESVSVPLLLMDAARNSGQPDRLLRTKGGQSFTRTDITRLISDAGGFSPVATKTITLRDGRSVTTDAAAADLIAALSGQIDALQDTVAGRNAQDSLPLEARRQAIADAARASLQDAERVRYSNETAWGRNTAAMSNAWRGTT